MSLTLRPAQTGYKLPGQSFLFIIWNNNSRLKNGYQPSGDFSDFPLDEAGAHIKLFFPEQQSAMPLLPYRNELGKIVWPAGKRPVTRTYTIRDFIAEQQLLVVDFVRHADFGTAANWAVHAQKGDVIGLAGPGGPARFNPEAGYFIFIGDIRAADDRCLAAAAER